MSKVCAALTSGGNVTIEPWPHLFSVALVVSAADSLAPPTVQSILPRGACLAPDRSSRGLRSRTRKYPGRFQESGTLGRHFYRNRSAIAPRCPPGGDSR